MDMEPHVAVKRAKIASWVLRIVLGILFLFVGTTKLTGTGNTIEYFAAIGWGQWFRYLTGVLDITGVVLLFLPRATFSRSTFYGSIVLACSVGTAAAISLTVLRGDPRWGAPQMIVVPLVITLLALTLAFLTRPHRQSSI